MVISEKRFVPWDVLSLGLFVLGRFVLGRLVLGRFVCASFLLPSSFFYGNRDATIFIVSLVSSGRGADAVLIIIFLSAK